MKYNELRQLKKKLFFTVDEVSYIFKINSSSARVLCSRYVKKGIFIRVKNNFYILRDKWETLSLYDFLKVANFLQVPSYVSFMTALAFYEITTQVQRYFFESACVRRSISLNAEWATFNFYKLKKEFYFGFIKRDDIFIALPEKAFVDSVYLYSFGKYKVDFNSLNIDKLDNRRIKKIIEEYPLKTKTIISRLCRI